MFSKRMKNKQFQLIVMCFCISLFVSLLVGLIVTISMREFLLITGEYNLINVVTATLRNSIIFGIFFMYLTYRVLMKWLKKNNIIS